MKKTIVNVLLRIELDDELLVRVELNIGSFRNGQEHARKVRLVERKPIRNRAVAAGPLERFMDDRKAAARFLHLDGIARRYEVRWDVDDLAANRNVTVQDKLTGRLTRRREVQAIHDVVQTAFEQFDQVLTGDATEARCFLERIAELRFEHPVQAADLLLLAELDAVFGNFLPAAKAVLPRRILPLFDGAFFRITLCPF